MLIVALQAAVGGRMRLFISGGAPLPTYAGSFMATAMNVPVLQVRRHMGQQQHGHSAEHWHWGCSHSRLEVHGNSTCSACNICQAMRHW
jgi:hypothetical protein